MLKTLIPILFAGLTATAASAAPQVATPDATALRGDIQAMKDNPRGPFQRIRWFCADGTVLPPKAYACVEHGGGRQHGEWSDATLRVRAAGFPVANVLAALGPGDFGDAPAQQRHLAILLLERFLQNVDDGWILRRARYYRGAFQIEAEIASADEILKSLVVQERWRTTRYPLLMEAVRLMPSGGEEASAASVRGLATALNTSDPGFGELRNKIHNVPDAGDADRVRSYARRDGQPEFQPLYAELAEAIDDLYSPDDLAPLLQALAPRGTAGEALLGAIPALERPGDDRARISTIAGVMVTLRDSLGSFGSPARQLDALRLQLAMANEVFILAQPLVMALEQGSDASRAARLTLMNDFLDVAYGLGLLTGFERAQVHEAMQALGRPDVPLATYRRGLAYLDRVAGWAARRLAFFFEEPAIGLAVIEPLALEYIPHRLRSSPLLHYGRVLDGLAADATLLGDVRSELFGEETVTGLRSLNPGVGSGVLRTLEELEGFDGDTRDSIVIAPHTVAELPVVAGILTENEGNALSHVQLLARNLGIPNVVVAGELLAELRAHLGRRVTLAASPGGVVRLRDDDSPAVDTASAQLSITVDTAKLDLETDRPIPTSELGQADSGVRVGPKAAQLGELTGTFTGQVSPGLALPFGAFKDLLDQPRFPGGISTFEWMKATYTELEAIEDASERNRRARPFLAALRQWILDTELDPAFVARLRTALDENFGPDGSFGVFVRSDTNVEDLEGFTGAGLNLTVPHVVGNDNIIAAIRQVWASPFTERAFGWRQALMDTPEHVYVAVLLHKSVNSEKSGVLITSDLDSGDREFITVVANEGVGGGVEGQSAEALKVRLRDGQVTLLNSATAPTKTVLLAGGGTEHVPASGADRLLSDTELGALRAFTGRLENWFGNLPAEKRAEAIADVEFGFLDEQLILFQIRPFVESRGAATNAFLIELDAPLARTANRQVNMNAPPEEAE